MRQLCWPGCWGPGCCAPRCSTPSPVPISVPSRPHNQQRQGPTWSSPPQLSVPVVHCTNSASFPSSSAFPSLPHTREKLASLSFLCLKASVPCPQVVLLVYHWSSRESEHDLLVHKAVAKWTAEEVVLWLEQLGPWASLYRDRFLSERVNGR